MAIQPDGSLLFTGTDNSGNFALKRVRLDRDYLHPQTFTALDANGYSQAIALDKHKIWTLTDIRVTGVDGRVGNHLLAIDPPAASGSGDAEPVYRESAHSVTEGDAVNVQLDLVNGEAPQGGATFDVTANFNDQHGQTCSCQDKVGAIPASVTIPEGERSVDFTISAIDNETWDYWNGRSAFTVTFTSTNDNWSSSNLRATVTITDNDPRPQPDNNPGGGAPTGGGNPGGGAPTGGDDAGGGAPTGGGDAGGGAPTGGDDAGDGDDPQDAPSDRQDTTDEQKDTVTIDDVKEGLEQYRNGEIPIDQLLAIIREYLTS